MSMSPLKQTAVDFSKQATDAIQQTKEKVEKERNYKRNSDETI